MTLVLQLHRTQLPLIYLLTLVILESFIILSIYFFLNFIFSPFPSTRNSISILSILTTYCFGVTSPHTKTDQSNLSILIFSNISANYILPLMSSIIISIYNFFISTHNELPCTSQFYRLISFVTNIT